MKVKGNEYYFLFLFNSQVSGNKYSAVNNQTQYNYIVLS